MAEPHRIQLPPDLVPADGRFGSGPARVRIDDLDALAATGATFLGTSHRTEGVRSVVRAIRHGLASLYGLPAGYEVLLGLGGATAFWDAAAFGLIERRSQHLVFGEFSRKFADVASGAPWLDEPEILESDAGGHPVALQDPEIDTYALTHNETSTGVTMRIVRPAGGTSLVLVDGTSAAGAVTVTTEEFDVYYFSPQKALGSDGGLWIAMCSPAAISRIEAITADGRWVPPFLSLTTALANSRKDQTYNTPALATLYLLAAQITRLAADGGLAAAEAQCRSSAGLVYSWAETSGYAEPFVKIPAQRSITTPTIDLDQRVSVETVISVLAAHGVVDVGGYRKLGRNQLRIATFPNVDRNDLEKLVASIDYIAQRL